MKKTTWPGNWKVACDVCGMWFPSGEMQKRWDGLVVCHKDFETRHPSTLYNYKGHVSVPSFIRKDPVDQFVFVCTIQTNSAYADMGTADCMQADNTRFTYSYLQDFFTNGHE
jgi:hypothetical protein